MRRAFEFLLRLVKPQPARLRKSPTIEYLTGAQLKRLGALIGYTIREPEHFTNALIHRSYLQRLPSNSRSNERLEFLGDSILNLVVAEYLYRKFPDAEEGELTKTRSRLVNRKALAAYSRTLHLPEFILMSPSAAQSIDKGSEAIIADTFEAIIAAIYLDGGFAAARDFVLTQVTGALKIGTIASTDENYKSKLLEYSQSHGMGTPRYQVARQDGPDHDRTFTVDVLVAGVNRGTGTGKNKKEAEQAAAGQALEWLLSEKE
jgi:ribonuclease-3